MAAVADDVLAFLYERRDDIVAFLERLTLLESPSSEPATHAPVREALAAELERLGFATRNVAGRISGGQLYARPGQRQRHAPRQLIVGHFDTVWPLGTLNDMPFDYDGQIVRGPGVFDMKGGLVQLVFALQAMAHFGLTPSVTPVVFLNSDEEIGSRDSTRYICSLARIANRALILEPSLGPDGAIKTARKGVGRYTVTVKGKAAHAGLDPEAGVSAIHELSHVIQQLFAFNEPERGISVNVGTIEGGLRPNVVAPESRAVIDVRVATREDAERIDARIKGIKPKIGGIDLVIDGSIGRPALERTPRNRAFWQLAREIGAELGLELSEAMAGGGSDGNTTSLYTATLDGLGPVGDGAHALHEQLDIDRTIERAAFLALLLLAPALEEIADE
jgi:glutamate carboxypeptidase